MKASAVAAVAVTAVVALSGCGILPGTRTDDSAQAAPAATAVATPAASTTPSATSGFGTVKEAGDIPDPCGLLTQAEVTDLTGRGVSQMDPDGEQSGATTRYCQWQQPSGQLDIFLSRTTESDFQTVIEGSQPVDGVGEAAFSLSGHLYVLYGTVDIDVYSRGDSDEKNLEIEKQIAKVLIPKI
jgi:Protein of unknown function (DUF3558)